MSAPQTKYAYNDRSRMACISRAADALLDAAIRIEEDRLIRALTEDGSPTDRPQEVHGEASTDEASQTSEPLDPAGV